MSNNNGPRYCGESSTDFGDTDQLVTEDDMQEEDDAEVNPCSRSFSNESSNSSSDIIIEDFSVGLPVEGFIWV